MFRKKYTVESQQIFFQNFLLTFLHSFVFLWPLHLARPAESEFLLVRIFKVRLFTLFVFVRGFNRSNSMPRGSKISIFPCTCMFDNKDIKNCLRKNQSLWTDPKNRKYISYDSKLFFAHYLFCWSCANWFADLWKDQPKKESNQYWIEYIPKLKVPKSLIS